MNWEPDTEARFKTVISKLPIFHRRIAESAVTQRAEESALARKSPQVQEQDVIAAFFSDVPSPFYSMMVRLLDEAGFDYRRYGYPKNR
jgi:hypothetical protein